MHYFLLQSLNPQGPCLLKSHLNHQRGSSLWACSKLGAVIDIDTGGENTSELPSLSETGRAGRQPDVLPSITGHLGVNRPGTKTSDSHRGSARPEKQVGKGFPRCTFSASTNDSQASSESRS